MAEEFEYAVLTRYRANDLDENSVRPMPPKWGPWSKWGQVRVFPTLAGAAMSASGRNVLHRTYDRDPEKRVIYAQTQAQVAFRKVPSEWTPVLPVLEES